ncbi:MAG: membrane protein insertion efficiency factor YidD [Gammaproteobacteria bacterium]|jgi:putative membrane protein insertion efficiency factor|nr:membrane protein insertion efficiency factor YidD [Gammaproteobacteria bacterium]
MRWLIRWYRRWLSPMLAPRCRFQPTCSAYALEAMERFGEARGLWLALLRLLRCHPWGGCGYDPVPERFSWWPGHAATQRKTGHGGGRA